MTASNAGSGRDATQSRTIARVRRLLTPSRRNSPKTFGHFGQAGTFLWVDPDAGVACVALTDRPFGPWAAEVWPEFADAVLAELD